MVHYSYNKQSKGWCGESPASIPRATLDAACDEQDYGGLDLYVGDAILDRYFAHAQWISQVAG